MTLIVTTLVMIVALSEADEPIESEQPYIAPDGREHILEVGDDTENIKKPQSGNTK
jgi:hypothetical protein